MIIKKQKTLPTLIPGFLVFIAFSALTLLVRADFLRQFDWDMTVKIQDRIPVRYDDTLTFFSLFGRFEFTFGALLLIIVIYYRNFAGIASFILFGFAHVIELIGKSVLTQPGPPDMLLRTTHVNDFPGLYVYTQASYPSGHSLRTVFLAVLITYFIFKLRKLNLQLRLFVISGVVCFTIIMLVSRVSLGEHWMSDVIGGSLLGLSFSLFALLFI